MASDDFTYDPSDSTAIQLCTTTASSIVIPSPVKRIERFAFSSDSCPNLKTVTFDSASAFTTVDGFAFSGSKIESITFPPNSISLGESSFRSMEKLNTLNFTGNITVFPPYFLSECPNLHYFYMSGQALMSNGFLNFSKLPSNSQVLRSAFALSSITSVYVPENFMSRSLTAYINLFEHCEQLHSVRVDYSLPYIPLEMFHGCSELVSVTVGGVQIYSNYNLDLTGSTTVKQLMSGSFRETNIRFVNIPSDFRNISNDAFAECSMIETINIASPFETFGHPDFQGLISLVNVTIGPYNIIKNKKLDLDGTPTTFIDAYEYSGTDIIEAILPNECRRLFTSCFADCESLLSVTLSPNVEFASHSVFSGCHNLERIILGGEIILQDGVFDVSSTSLRFIAVSTFEFSGRINTLVICESLYLSKNAFRASFNLKKITFKSTNGITINEEAFRDCPQIQYIEYTNGVTCSSLSKIDFKAAFRGSNVGSSDWCDFHPPTAPPESGLSGGAKAAIAIVIIVVVAAVVVFLVWYVMTKTNICLKLKGKQYQGTLINE